MLSTQKIELRMDETAITFSFSVIVVLVSKYTSTEAVKWLIQTYGVAASVMI